jgi:small subunit ribosomal protein S6
MTNWGPFALPRPKIRAHQASYNHGHYFVLRFDAAAKTQEEIRRMLRLDPRVIRFGVTRVEAEKRDAGILTGRGIVPWRKEF